MHDHMTSLLFKAIDNIFLSNSVEICIPSRVILNCFNANITKYMQYPSNPTCFIARLRIFYLEIENFSCYRLK
jgi:hypothetical protein